MNKQMNWCLLPGITFAQMRGTKTMSTRFKEDPVASLPMQEAYSKAVLPNSQ